jgi:hypothetical protein
MERGAEGPATVSNSDEGTLLDAEVDAIVSLPSLDVFRGERISGPDLATALGT